MPCSSAPAEAGRIIAGSGSPNQRVTATASVGGLDGPRMIAISTTDSAKASTTQTGSRISGQTCGMMILIQTTPRP